MKAFPIQAVYVLIAIAVMYLIYRRKRVTLEGYVKRPASIDEVLKLSENGLVKMYPYDLKYPRKYTFEKDGEYFRIKGKFMGMNESYYFSVKDGDVFHMTSTEKPEGEIKWRLVSSITNHDGYYSIASKDSETYLFLDITFGDGGVVNLANKEEVQGIDNPASVNFTFTRPSEKATIAPVVKV
jgi:hypothetical protein